MHQHRIHVIHLITHIPPMDAKAVWIVIVCFVFPLAALSQTVHRSEITATPDTIGCSLFIASQPVPAKIFLDSVLVGRTPLEMNGLKEKKYAVSIVSPEYAKWSAVVEMAPGKKISIMAVLTEKKGLLSVRLSPENAAVLFDARPLSGGIAGRYEVPYGTHEIGFRSDSLRRSITESFIIEPEGELSLSARLGVRSMTATGMSILVPGSGQIWDGATLKGIAYTAGTAALALMSWKLNETYQTDLNAYTSLRDRYIRAQTEADIVRFRGPMKEAKNAADKSYRSRTIAYAAFVGVYLANVLDAFLFHHVADEIEVITNEHAARVGAPAAPEALQFSCGIAVPL